MKIWIVTPLVLIASPVSAATYTDIEGEWVVDLRVNAKTDKPYTQPMVIKIAPDRQVKGQFYNSDASLTVARVSRTSASASRSKRLMAQGSTSTVVVSSTERSSA